MKRFSIILLLCMFVVCLIFAACNKPGDGESTSNPTGDSMSTPAIPEKPIVSQSEPSTLYIPPVKETAAPALPPVKATAAPDLPPVITVTSKGYKVTQKDGLTYVDGVLVVNKTYSLPSDYNPGALTAECAAAFNEMKAAAAAEGLNIYIASGFRSYELQQSLYSRYVAADGKANADTYSARPGYSEHQTGLAIDLNSISFSFADTSEGRWVNEHCAEYGFILRYPKGKEAQTGYCYEPWHIRYVGAALAVAVTESGLCLEEYYGITSSYAE